MTDLELKAYFKDQIKNIPEDPDPYLKTRVLAQIREKQMRSKLQLWKWLTASFAAVASLALFLNLRSIEPKDGLVGGTNQAVVIQMQLDEINTDQLAYVEIELPEGVSFYSKTSSKLREKRLLHIAWNDKARKELPFAITAGEPGRRKVKVRFYNNNAVVAEKSININFKRSI